MTNSRKRHTPEQVVRKLGQADRMLAGGSDIAGVCRELGVSEQTYYRWRNQYGGLKALRILGGGEGVKSAGDQEHAEPVVVVVGEAAGDPAGEFDEPVHGLGASVG